MIVNDPSSVIKGMIFAGCSFTWGQGLYYYSNMPNIIESLPHSYDSNLVKFTHYEYMRSVRFPRIVANHFNSFEICQPFNGGASYSIHGWWEEAFSISINNFDIVCRSLDQKMSAAISPDRYKCVSGDFYYQKYDYEDFSHIIYQFTQWARGHSPAMICTNDDGAIVKTTHYTTMSHNDFPNWLKGNNLTEAQYIDQAILQEVQDAKNFLQNFEKQGIKVYVMSWPWEMIPYIKQDPWFDNKLIEFDYQGQHYTNIEDMMGYQHLSHEDVPHPELTIFRDRAFFKEPPVDHHPSLTCHRVIAENVIRHLEKDIR